MRRNEVGNPQIDFIAKKVFLSANQLVTAQVTGASTVLTAGLGSGAPNLVELGTSNIGALKMALTTDEFDWLWVPSDFDNRHKVLIRYLWTSDYGTASGTARFDTLYTAMQTGTAVAAAATALTITPGASTKTAAAARALYWSKYGYLAPIATASNANHTFHPDTIAIAFNLKVGAVTGITIASDFVYVLGVELTYTPRLAFGANARPARLLVNGLHSNVELDVTNDI